MVVNDDDVKLEYFPGDSEVIGSDSAKMLLEDINRGIETALKERLGFQGYLN